MTIKKRIVIWYTIWMAVLVAIASAVLLSGSGALMRREAMADLEETVHDAAEDIRIGRDGRVRLDDDMEFFDDGTYLSVWEDGSIIAGRFPDEVSAPEPADGAMREIPGAEGEWYCFDLMLSDGVFLRGASRVYGMGALMSSLHLLVILLLPAVVLLAAFGGYVIVRRSFRPADKVIATAGEIAGSDDLSKRIALGEGCDEIHQMAWAFDSMLDRIEHAFEKEKQFTSDASHELRTPIAVILAETEYAKDHAGDEAKMEESLSVIARQAGRMSRLVSELLLIARSDKGTLTPHPEHFDVSELCEIVAGSMEDTAAERNISLHVDSPFPVMIDADRDMIARAVMNLISNAVKYGREGGNVFISAAEKGKEAVISVRDDGIGIAQSHLGRIWDRFYQVDPSRTSSSDGAGLGLSIVREIIRLHHGTVSAESVEGLGSVFTIRLPLAEK